MNQEGLSTYLKQYIFFIIFYNAIDVIWWPRDFVLYILAFGLVRLRTFHLAHGLVRCNMSAGVHVSFRHVKIKIPDRNMTGGMWMTSCTGSVRRRFGGFEKSQLNRVLASEEDGWLSELAEALWRVPRVVWGRWKSRHRKIVPLSSSCRKTF